MDIKIFEEHLESLKDISVDNHDPKHKEYMTESEFVAVNFDEVKTEYAKRIESGYMPKSSDALVKRDNGSVMIEFKNGVVDTELVAEIREKMLSSVIVYCEITGRDAGYTRENMDYILVYNYDKNPFNAHRYAAIRSRDRISGFLHKKAKSRFKQFGLHMFEGYIYRNVYTYSKNDFEKYFTSKLEA